MNRPWKEHGGTLGFATASRSASQKLAVTERFSLDDRRRILAVDDDHTILELIDAFLVDCDYRVYLAGSGFQALDILRRSGGAIDLLLVDVQMPGVNGPELYERAADSYPGVQVLFMSGFDAAQGVRYGLPVGAPLLTKPFGPAELQERLRQVFARY